ncbi:hypothetical protein [Roseomonas xinghualingensis]|uniref:hypothetical protein n=1 Tax=Roseomonas xinghualingensis TaxID=2986475 RepID=UPI0021F20846|nr:hypothetical protein [Roseomonas sp. SXEYE001]MCV4209360.1 hypothetical protein [Roseomonas sp. SXEYE001]
MRLADQLMAMARHKGHPCREDFARVAEAVRSAERYEIEPAAGTVIAGVGKRDAKHLRSLRGLARSTASAVWVEWVGTSGAFYGNHDPCTTGQVRPDRCGLLIETDASRQRGQITQCWTAVTDKKRMFFEVLPICAVFDWRDQPAPVPSIFPRDPNRPIFGGGGPRTARERRIAEQISTLTPDEIRAEEDRVGFISNHRMQQLEDILDVSSRQDPIGNARRVCSMMDDWLGEVNFAYAILVGLNSPEKLRIKAQEDLTAQNKVRRRLGRPELLAFSVVKPASGVAA